MTWSWRIFFVVFMIWMAKNCAAYLTTPDASQLKDYGPSMTYKDLNPNWNPNRRIQ